MHGGPRSEIPFSLSFNANFTHCLSPFSLDGLTDGTTKVQEVMEARSSKRFCLLLRRFRLDVHGSDFTNTDVSVMGVAMGLNYFVRAYRKTCRTYLYARFEHATFFFSYQIKIQVPPLTLWLYSHHPNPQI